MLLPLSILGLAGGTLAWYSAWSARQPRRIRKLDERAIYRIADRLLHRAYDGVAVEIEDRAAGHRLTVMRRSRPYEPVSLRVYLPGTADWVRTTEHSLVSAAATRGATVLHTCRRRALDGTAAAPGIEIDFEDNAIMLANYLEWLTAEMWSAPPEDLAAVMRE